MKNRPSDWPVFFRPDFFKRLNRSRMGLAAQLVRPVMPIRHFSLAIMENQRLDCACTGHTGKTTIIKS
jgi:hypothetical protein